MAKILLVEDDKSLREIYGVRLMAEGYEIVSAGDGEEALAMAIKERPDLIVSDVMMPKISGFDMLDILRSTTETKNVKVIMMTALSSEDQRARGEALGADRYLVKSQVGIEDVVRTVHDVLSDGPPVLAPAVPFTAPVTPQPVQAPAPVPAEPSYAPTPMPTPVPAPVPVAPIEMPVFPEPVVAPAPQPVQTAPAEPAYAGFTPTPRPYASGEPTTATPAPAPAFMQPTTPVVLAPLGAQQAVPQATQAEPTPATAPAPSVAPATPYEQQPQAVPTPVAPAFGPAPITMPQPTAPFSSPAPASLGERVISPLSDMSAQSTNVPDLGSQMDQALNGAVPVAPAPNTPPAL